MPECNQATEHQHTRGGNFVGPRGTLITLLLLLSVILIISRFVALGTIPDGFFLDEAAIATQVICVRETGADAQGSSTPLFAPVLGGGQASPVLLYPAALWTAIAGDSIASLRSFSALHALLLALAISTAVAVAQQNLIGGLVTLVIALSSPWLFAQSRVFWDPIIGASWWAVAMSAYWLARQKHRSTNRRLICWTACGLAAAAAAYAYPPIRVQLVFSLIAIFFIDRSWRNDRTALLALTLLLFSLIPLALTYLNNPWFSERGNLYAIWNADWLRSQNASWIDIPAIALKNLARHLDPAYLLLHGDSNLRHNSGFGGLIGPVETAVTIVALFLAPRFLVSRDSLLLLALFAAGLLPAALTWEGVPHALRSIGAIGPLMLWFGFAACAALGKSAGAWRIRLLTLWLLVAVAGGLRYGYDYFMEFPGRSTAWFGGNAPPGDLPQSLQLASHYFRLQDGSMHCPGAREAGD